MRNAGTILRRLLVIMGFLLLLVSCSRLREVKVDFDYAAFTAQRDLWETTQPSNYQYHLDHVEVGLYAPTHALIQVENGQFKDYVSDSDYSNTGVNPDLSTISGIYRRIEQDYKANNHSKRSKHDVYLLEIEMEYDEVRHIPLKITKRYHIPKGWFDFPGNSWTEITDFKRAEIVRLEKYDFLWEKRKKRGLTKVT